MKTVGDLKVFLEVYGITDDAELHILEDGKKLTITGFDGTIDFEKKRVIDLTIRVETPEPEYETVRVVKTMREMAELPRASWHNQEGTLRDWGLEPSEEILHWRDLETDTYIFEQRRIKR